MSTAPPRVPVPLALMLGLVTGVLTHLPFAALGRTVHPWIGVAAAFGFCVFDPVLTVPVAWFARRRGLDRIAGTRFGALAGLVSGTVAGLFVATSALDLSPSAPTDGGALVYPLVTLCYGAVAGMLGGRQRP